jgi:integrase/recombinase XerD
MLNVAVDSYLARRRAAGYQLKDQEGILRDFARFASAKGEAFVRSQTVLEWIRARHGSPLRSRARLRTVVHLARYLHAEDDRHEVPPAKALRRPRLWRRPPFVFTPQQVTALIREAGTLGPQSSLQPRVYSTLFGLLACTGLRISEALNLRFEDVTSEGLLIRNTKFGKSRLLALHPSTRKVLDRYLERRGQEAGTCPYLFVSWKGRQLHENTARGVFRRLVRSLGIAGPNDEPRPRLHDLRFYFANQVMANSPGDHTGISRHMVALTTYLGHSDVRNSYWYLEASPKLLSRIAESCESFAKGENR